MSWRLQVTRANLHVEVYQLQVLFYKLQIVEHKLQGYFTTNRETDKESVWHKEKVQIDGHKEKLTTKSSIYIL